MLTIDTRKNNSLTPHFLHTQPRLISYRPNKNEDIEADEEEKNEENLKRIIRLLKYQRTLEQEKKSSHLKDAVIRAFILFLIQKYIEGKVTRMVEERVEKPVFKLFKK